MACGEVRPGQHMAVKWWLGQQLFPKAGPIDVVGMAISTIAKVEYCFNAALDQATLYLHVHELLQGASATSEACRSRSQAPFFLIPTTPDDSSTCTLKPRPLLACGVRGSGKALVRKKSPSLSSAGQTSIGVKFFEKN